MAKFKNTITGVVVSVADAKAGRFGDGWEAVDAPIAKQAEQPSATKTSSK